LREIGGTIQSTIASSTRRRLAITGRSGNASCISGSRGEMFYNASRFRGENFPPAKPRSVDAASVAAQLGENVPVHAVEFTPGSRYAVMLLKCCGAVPVIVRSAAEVSPRGNFRGALIFPRRANC